MLNIRQCHTEEDFNFLKNLMINSAGIKEIFENNSDRLASASIITLVEEDNIPIGFIYVTHEFSDNRIGFLDMGLISSKRGYGHGKKALDIFNYKTRDLDMFFVAETKKENMIANRVLSNYKHLYNKDDLCFYLVNKSIEELKEEGLYDELIDHLNSDRVSSKNSIKRLY